MTCRIRRSDSADGAVFALSGEIDEEHAAELERLLAAERHARIRVDLSDVTLVDRESVTVLSRAEAAGVLLVNCPEYVRSWIDAERRGG